LQSITRGLIIIIIIIEIVCASRVKVGSMKVLLALEDPSMNSKLSKLISW
jgi:hypothetical protein